MGHRVGVQRPSGATPISVARPRKARKPIESVVMVTNTEEATAGSAPKRSSVTGTSTPASPAISTLNNTASAITTPRIGLPKTSAVPLPSSALNRYGYDIEFDADA